MYVIMEGIEALNTDGCRLWRFAKIKHHCTGVAAVSAESVPVGRVFGRVSTCQLLR